MLRSLAISRDSVYRIRGSCYVCRSGKVVAGAELKVNFNIVDMINRAIQSNSY